MVDILSAESVINKWDPEASGYAKITSFFQESREEVDTFLKAVKRLQSAMHFYIDHDPRSFILVHSQKLMKIAMKRLQAELFQILSTNRDHLDPESISGSSSTHSSTSSVSEENYETELETKNSIKTTEGVPSIAISDLRLIVNCMIESGYGKECVQIYKNVRKSIVDEALYRQDFQKQSSSQIQKLDWPILDQKIKKWLLTIKVAFKTLFSGERKLCDHVFSSSDATRESCFVAISKDAALNLLEFAEFVAKCKNTYERIFRLLDLYETIFNLWPDIESIFSFESAVSVRTQALNSLTTLEISIQSMLWDFQQTIHKDKTKGPVPGGGHHPLTLFVMNYLISLCDYSEILNGLLVFDNSNKSQSLLPISSPRKMSPIAEKFSETILILICKLDGKSESYRNPSLSYLFLANNLAYIFQRIRESDLLLHLGEEWIAKHEQKAIQYAENYEKTAWKNVYMSFDEDLTVEVNPEKAESFFQKFNSAFEEAYRVQSTWVVPYEKLRNELKLSIARKIVPKYREIYEKYLIMITAERNHHVYIRFAPEDLDNYLSDLFYGNGGFCASDSHTGSGSSSASNSVRSNASR